MNICRFLILVFLCANSVFAHAYIGPGLAGGAVASILGIVLGILLLIVGVIWYPIKKVLGRLSSKVQGK